MPRQPNVKQDYVAFSPLGEPLYGRERTLNTTYRGREEKKERR
jgi:hypothetical protein